MTQGQSFARASTTQTDVTVTVPLSRPDIPFAILDMVERRKPMSALGN